jgi:hypothetical protein
MRLSPHTLRWGCARARANGFAPSASPVGGLPRGDSPRSIPRCLAPPLPSSALRTPPFGGARGALEVLTTGVCHTRMRAHATLLTLTPTFPSRPDPCGPAFRLDFLSWVCPKIAPPSSHVEESGARVRVSAAPSGNDSRSLPRSALVVSHHLGSFLLSDGAGLLHPAPDPGVHRVSVRRETGILTVRSCPSKLSLRRQRRLRLSPEPRARVTNPSIAERVLHRVPCPLTLHSVHREDGFPSTSATPHH